MAKKVYPPSIYDEYFQCVETHLDQCGPKTVVLMQLGDFYEMYDKPHVEQSITNRIVHEIIDNCSLATSCSRTYKGEPLMMAGVHQVSIDKYVQMIVEAGYNAVVYVQTNEYNENSKKLKRVLKEIHSPSTFITSNTHNEIQTSNFVMCIWIESNVNKRTHPNQLAYGIAVLNNYDGKSFMYQAYLSDNVQCTSFDEIEHFVSVYRPRECIIINNVKSTEGQEKLYKQLLQYSGLTKLQDLIHIHKYDFDRKEVIHCSKQSYLNEILNTRFGDDCLFQCAHFLQYLYATQAFCFLLHFVEERNRSLIKHIYMPIFMNLSKRMTLANHTLKQLNILSDQNEHGKECGHLQSVHTFLNKCNSAIGKRRFHHIITHPTFDETWLTTEYEMMDCFLDEPEHHEMIGSLRTSIRNILDLDKIVKQISTYRLCPNVLSKTFSSIQTIELLFICLDELPQVQTYLCTTDFLSNVSQTTTYDKTTMIQNVRDLLQYLDSQLILEKCSTCNNLTSFDENIIQPGMCETLDTINSQYVKCCQQLDVIQQYFESCMPGNKNDCIKRNVTEKNGVSLQLTKTRSETLKRQLLTLKDVDIVLEHDVKFKTYEVEFSSPGKTTMEIRFPLLDSICTNITRLKNGINEQIRIQYMNILQTLDDKYVQTFEQCSLMIGKLDVLLCKCHCALTYNYTKPIIDVHAEKSYFDAKDIRHVLIEQLLTQETYVPNDLCLGWRDSLNASTRLEEVDGILLYGTNAVGKTSLIRALGIVIIMAQSGMYVPCSSFKYKPYHSMYSRILSNDNLFKGLSTFAVEMSELRVILQNADKHSFIMGDELCSGTETESALSIVMASLEHLHERESTFMFATHFHEIVDYEEMKSLQRIQLKHLQVHYDETTQDLIYERKIQDGPGQRTYGLEVCKSLFMEPLFMNRTYELRTKYFDHTKGPLSIDSSHYNVKKIKGKCELCGVLSKTNEIHHLEEQQYANIRGFIGSIHKNHPGNLMTLCESCHDKMHHSSSSQNPSFDLSPLTDDDSRMYNPTLEMKKKIIKKKKTTSGYKPIESEVYKGKN